MFRTKMLAGATVVAVLVLASIPTFTTAGSPAPLNRTGTAHPKDYDVYTVRFRAGEMARVWVTNLTSNADLDVRVIDPLTLQVVAQDNRVNRDASVQFFPPRGGEYIIVIHNFSGARGAQYRVSTN